MKSALARLQAIGMFHRTAIRTRAFTSESCGCWVSEYPEEDQQVDVPLGDPRADLLVAAEQAGLETGHPDVELVGQHAPGRAGGEQVVPGEHVPVVARPLQQTLLLVVVRDQRDTPAPGPAGVRAAGLGGTDFLGRHPSSLPAGCYCKGTRALSGCVLRVAARPAGWSAGHDVHNPAGHDDDALYRQAVGVTGVIRMPGQRSRISSSSASAGTSIRNLVLPLTCTGTTTVGSAARASSASGNGS